MKGLFSAYKLKKVSKSKRLNDKAYKHRLTGKIYKRIIGNKPQANAIVLEKRGVEAKQPNSAIRKICKVQCIGTGKVIFAFAPGDGCLKIIEVNDEVTIQYLGRGDKSVGDRPGIKFKIIKVSGVSVSAILAKKKQKPSK